MTLLLEYRPLVKKEVKMPCFGSKCELCGWSPKRSNPKKVCHDARHKRPWIDIKPFGYKDDGRRYWRF